MIYYIKWEAFGLQNCISTLYKILVSPFLILILCTSNIRFVAPQLAYTCVPTGIICITCFWFCSYEAASFAHNYYMESYAFIFIIFAAHHLMFLRWPWRQIYLTLPWTQIHLVWALMVYQGDYYLESQHVIKCYNGY